VKPIAATAQDVGVMPDLALGEMVVSYRGTDGGGDIDDWGSGGGFQTDQAGLGAEFYRAVIANDIATPGIYDADVTFAGHSVAAASPGSWGPSTASKRSCSAIWSRRDRIAVTALTQLSGGMTATMNTPGGMIEVLRHPPRWVEWLIKAALVIGAIWLAINLI
jgi:hypothetical protein